MKIGLLTFHSAYNYGAVLQCYALNRVINILNNECETIDYRPQYFQEIYNIEKAFSWKRPPIKTWIRHFCVRKVIESRNQNFENFIKKYIPLSRNRFYSVDEINSTISNYDMLITGSDQVWNDRCAMFDPVYFAFFSAANAMKKASYAASFGVEQIPESLKEEYKRRVSRYDFLSVREEKGKEIINELIHKDATVCCDPTLLLTMEQWSDLIENQQPEAPYILVYYVNKTQKLQKYAKRISEKYGYRIICIPCNMDMDVLKGNNDKGLVDELITDCSPQNFLYLIKNAELILTNSFHGTVFSIIFQKSFWVDLQINPNTYNYRARTLLEKLSIQQDDIDTFIENKSNINWDEVRVKLNNMREKGIEYLKLILDHK